jgi:hypothetical protein
MSSASKSLPCFLYKLAKLLIVRNVFFAERLLAPHQRPIVHKLRFFKPAPILIQNPKTISSA